MVYSIVIAVLAAYFLGNLNGAVCISAIVSDDDVRYIVDSIKEAIVK